jgi:hypothetical protein
MNGRMTASISRQMTELWPISESLATVEVCRAHLSNIEHRSSLITNSLVTSFKLALEMLLSEHVP